LKIHHETTATNTRSDAKIQTGLQHIYLTTLKA